MRKCNTKVKLSKAKPSKAKHSTSPRVPQYMSPLEGRRLLEKLPQFTPPVKRPNLSIATLARNKFVKIYMEEEGLTKEQAENKYTL